MLILYFDKVSQVFDSDLRSSPDCYVENYVELLRGKAIAQFVHQPMNLRKSRKLIRNFLQAL